MITKQTNQELIVSFENNAQCLVGAWLTLLGLAAVGLWATSASFYDAQVSPMFMIIGVLFTLVGIFLYADSGLRTTTFRKNGTIAYEHQLRIFNKTTSKLLRLSDIAMVRHTFSYRAYDADRPGSRDNFSKIDLVLHDKRALMVNQVDEKVFVLESGRVQRVTSEPLFNEVQAIIAFSGLKLEEVDQTNPGKIVASLLSKVFKRAR